MALLKGGTRIFGTATVDTSLVISGTGTSISTTTGALVVAGGVGIAGNLYTNGQVFATLSANASTSATTHHVFYNPVTKELTTSTGGAAGSSVTISDTPPISPSAGNMWFDSSSANLRIYYTDQDGSQWVDANSGVSSPQDSFTGPYAVNDISSQFDGRKAVFALKLDQTAINTIVDSKDVEVVINGQILTPYVKELRYPWLTPYDSYRGFRVVGSKLIIYNAPYIGDSASITVRSASTTQQTRRYPFSATTIALGD